MKRAIKTCILLIFCVAINLNAQSEVEQKYDILFKNAKTALAENRQKEAQLYLEVLTSNYPNSPRNNDAILLLENIYIHSGQDSLFLSIYELYSKEKSPEQTFWLGQSYYNLANYEKAKTVFISLYNEQEYLLRAKAMMALIAVSEQGYEAGLQKFLELKENHIDEESYYDFVLLSIARLYNLSSNFDAAVSFYESYLLMQNGDVSDEIIYEVANLEIDLRKEEELFQISWKHFSDLWQEKPFMLLDIKFKQTQILDQKLKETQFTDESQRIEEYTKKRAYKKQIYETILEFIIENPDSPQLATLYFNLAELSVEIDEENPEQTLEYYQKVFEHNPDFSKRDAVLYNIGYYGFDAELNRRDEARYENIDLALHWPDSLRLLEENLKTAIDAYTELYKSFPESDYNTEAICRLGTIYFTIALDAHKPQKFYAKAIEYFDIVAKKRGEPLQYFGLFQRAWSYFASGQFELAIEDFTRVLSIIHKGTSKRHRVFFLADAIENMAYSLIEYDEDFDMVSLAAEKAKELFIYYLDEDYSRNLFQKAINLKLKYSAPMQAIDLYNAYIDLYPTSKVCPTFIDSIMNIYKRNSSRTRDYAPAGNLIIQEMERLVKDYRADSKWFVKNRKKNISDQLKVIREAYIFLEKKYFNNFVRTESEDAYLLYKALTEEFCEYNVFKDRDGLEKMEKMRENILDMSLELAEISQNPSHYFEAQKNFDDFNFLYPENENFFEYEENIFYCYERIFDILKPASNKKNYEDATWDMNLNSDELDMMYIIATYNYEDVLYFPDNPRPGKDDELRRIVYKRAELRYGREEFGYAFEDYQQLLNYEIADELKKHCNSTLAKICQMEGDFSQAGTYYKEASRYASKQEKASFHNNVLACIKLSAERLYEYEEYTGAALEYLRLAEEVEGEKKIAVIIKAIDAYREGEEFQKAIDLSLKIISKTEEKSVILAVLQNAWEISDSLNDWIQSENLRNQFIDKFKNSNEAYKVRRQIIGFYEGEQFKNRLKAAEMYLQLHADADEIDIGTDTKEAIYGSAIKIYEQLKMEDKLIELIQNFAKLYPDHSSTEDMLSLVAKIYIERKDVDAMLNFVQTYPERSQVELLLKSVAIIYNENNDIEAMLEFEKKYPDHPSSIELLKSIAAIYQKNDEAEKYEEMARYIYRKNPEIDLLSKIVANKLKELMNDIDTLFISKQYNLMDEQIAKFKNVDEKYKEDGLQLSLESIYARFQFYTNFSEKIQYAEEDFLNKTPQEHLKINARTKWKSHLFGKKKRIQTLIGRCNEIDKELIGLLKEGAKYGLKKNDMTHTLYLVAKVYDYAHEIVVIQVQEFIDISDQLNNAKMQKKPVYQKKTKRLIKKRGNEDARELKKKGASYYEYLLENFYDNRNYSDEWTEIALSRLIEWGVRSPKIYVDIYADSTWQINNMKIEDYAIAKDSAHIWDSVKISSQAPILDSAPVIEVTTKWETYLYNDLLSEIIPELLTIEYVATTSHSVILNGELIEENPIIRDTLAILERDIYNYSLSITKNLQRGINEIVFKIDRDSTSQDTSYFAAHFKLQYDKQDLEFARATEQRTLISDSTWFCKKGDVVVDSMQIPDSTWTFAGDANFSFFKSQIDGMEESEAFGIWHSEIDTSQAETTYFLKNITIETDVIDATARFVGQKTISMWVNGRELIDSQEMVVDNILMKVQSQEISVNEFRKGINSILIKVDGDIKYKGLIFEMNYTIQREAEHSHKETKTENREI